MLKEWKLFFVCYMSDRMTIGLIHREKIESKMHDPDLITAAMKLNQISNRKLFLNHTIWTKTTRSALEQRAYTRIHFCDYKWNQWKLNLWLDVSCLRAVLFPKHRSHKNNFCIVNCNNFRDDRVFSIIISFCIYYLYNCSRNW